MQLYREVKESGDCLTYYTPRGYPIHLKPIEITEEEIEKHANKLDSGGMNDFIEIAGFIQGAKWLLSKLKGE